MPRYAKIEIYTPVENEAWKRICSFAGMEFRTYSGLAFTFSVKGNELFFSRKTKSITRATVMCAYRNGRALLAANEPISGPKKLGVFGASYLYPIFVKSGLLEADSGKMVE